VHRGEVAVQFEQLIAQIDDVLEREQE
jgi:hypothetical protein